MTIENKYMARCLQLARYGEAYVAPNPMVGAVLVCEGKIIGEGYHRRYGEAHAEVNAIHSVKDEQLLARATLYVNLEPCSHYGKTPPCSKLIIDKKIPRVVIATLDPFPKVSGRGVKMLQDAGVDVTIGVMEKEALALNERFFWFHKEKSPYVLLKWAESADGYMDNHRLSAEVQPLFISTPATRRMVHKLRAEVDGIMVGRNTARLDDPSLTARFWPGKNPVRILVDRLLRIPRNSKLYDDSARTLIFTAVKAEPHPHVEFIQIDDQGDILKQVKDGLFQRGIQTLMVEGGPCLLEQFINSGVNEIRIETANVWLGNKGVKAPSVNKQVIRTIRMGDSSIRYFK